MVLGQYMAIPVGTWRYRNSIGLLCLQKLKNFFIFISSISDPLVSMFILKKSITLKHSKYQIYIKIEKENIKLEREKRKDKRSEQTISLFSQDDHFLHFLRRHICKASLLLIFAFYYVFADIVVTDTCTFLFYPMYIIGTPH